MQEKIHDRIIKGIILLVNNPQLFFKVIGSKFAGIRQPPKGPIRKEINGVQFEFDFDYGPQMKTMYFDAYEPLTIEAMKKFLKKGGTFIDVGASIGFLTAIGAGFVGKGGAVHSFEPAPRDFQRLKRLSEMNPDYKIIANPHAVGVEAGMATMDITSLSWIGWNTLVPNFMRRDAWKESIEVPVIRLDEYIRERKGQISQVSLIKIDVEGYEFFVLKGLQGYFEDNRNRPAIICEITPRLYPELLGQTLDSFSDYMRQYGYRPVSLFNPKLKVDITKLKQQADVLFISNSR